MGGLFYIATKLLIDFNKKAIFSVIMSDTSSLLEAAHAFHMDEPPQHVKAFGSGHINDTYRVWGNDDSKTSYLMQRINHNVFPEVDKLMENMRLVTDHLKQKIRETGDGNPELNALTIVNTKAGGLYHRDKDGNYWRMFLLLENTRSYDIVTSEQQAREGGRAFGLFQLMLSDLDATRIHEVLPGFHHIGKRITALKQAVAKDTKGRVAGCAEVIDFVLDRVERMHTVLRMGEMGELPLRITHNDTKFNNVLLDEHDKAQCVIDLDTVMPGYAAYDFGDAIRTIINSAAEDEADLSKIVLNLHLFEAYTDGYFSQASKFLTPEEVYSLVSGVLLLPYIIGVRFLTDYLEGDHYFKIHHEGHNLQRAKAQFHLVAQLEATEDTLRDIVDRVALAYELIPGNSLR